MTVVRRSAEPSFSELELGLAIDKDNMENECRNQPILFYHVAKRLAQAISERDQLHQRSKEIDAEVDIRLREELERREEKTTEKALESLRRTTPRVLEINSRMREAELKVGQLAALKDAYSSRGFMLRDLIQLYLANYYGSDMDRSETQRRSADAAIARNEQARARQRRLRE